MSPAARTPPALALLLLRTMLPASQAEALVGDLLESFATDCATRGETRARGWFWRETLVALVTVRPRRLGLATQPVTGDSTMRTFYGDLLHGARLLRRAPAFTALAVLTLGLGIGATTAIYSVAAPTLFHSVPYPQPDRLVMVWERDAEGGKSNFGWQTFVDVTRATRTLERTAATASWEVTLSGGSDPERVRGSRVSWTYFRVLGVQPALGRDFLESEDLPGNNTVVMLSHGLWQRRYAGDSSIVGHTIEIDGAPYTVAGVLPASYEDVISTQAQIWRVLGYGPALSYACRTCRHLRVIGRMKPNETIAQTNAELDGISAALVKEYPTDYPRSGTLVLPLQQQVTRAVRPVVLALLGAVVLVLLIACANVANLQLARAMRRSDEFAIRAALGASRARLARQLLAEGLLLALLGGIAGVVVAWLAVPALAARLPANFPRLASVRLDLGALGATAAVTLLVGILIGLVPVWHSGRRNLGAALRSGSRQAGPSRLVARAGLVVAEVALALMLLVGAGLLSRSLLRLLSVDAGIDATNVLTMQIQATGDAYATDAAVFANHDRVRDAVRALPGVEAVGTVTQLPLGGNTDMYGVRALDKPLANPELAPSADRYVVSPDFMRTMRIPILQGRGITESDDRDSAAKVVVMSAALAQKIWGNLDVIGKQVQVGDNKAPWRTVVGVAGNVRHHGLDEDRTLQLYVPERQWPWADFAVALVVRTHGEPTALAPAVRRAVKSVDPTQPIVRVESMQGVIADSTAQRRLALLLFGAFAFIAATLAAAGIYGVLSGMVAERTREIGVRIALGATPGNILQLVLSRGATLAAIGLVVGLLGALALGRFLQALLFAVSPADPLTLGVVAVLLGVIALLACVIPARRAVRVDPMTALRAE